MKNSDKYTLITGGSEGLGLELAKLFANDRHNLIIVAKNEEKLENIKIKCKIDYDIEVETIAIDFSVDNAWEKVIEFVEGKNLIVDNLINNVGVGSFGFFHESKEGFEENLININIVTLTKLTKYFLNNMIERGDGGILNVASTAAFVGGPKMSMYYASKAYVLSLTEAIHDEVNGLGIKVCCLCPGPIRTSFQEKAGIKKSEKSKRYLMNADKVAKEGYNGFLKGRTIVIPGYKNKLLVLGNRCIPRVLSRKIILMNNKE
jgi:uncharacterized protein